MSVGVALVSSGDTIQPFEKHPETSGSSSRARKIPDDEEKRRKLIVQSLSSVLGIGYHTSSAATMMF